MIQLRKITEQDLEIIMYWRMRPDITRWMYTDPVLTLDGQKKWLKGLEKNSTVQYWLIIIDGISSGVIYLTDFDKERAQTSWGYYIGEKSKRSFDVAISLEMSLYQYCFEVLKLNRVNGEVFSDNKPIIKLHKICGCTIVKEEEKAAEKDGVYYDVTYMTIDYNKWLEIKYKVKYKTVKFQIKNEEDIG